MSVAIIDYGSGNLHSAAKAFERAARGLEDPQKVFVTSDPQGPRAVGDEGDHIGSSQPDFSDVLSALQPLILPPPRRDLVVIDRQMPTSRTTCVEVFRPPQSCA